MDENFIKQLFIRSVNLMKDTEFEWPDHWDTKRKIEFLDSSLEWAVQEELYEQCTVLRDVKETLIK
jgi:hypothetical protein